MRSIDESFYKASRWRRCRDAYIKAHPLCEECLKSGKVEPSRYVHHIRHMNAQTVKDASLAYGEKNLQALCFDCHEQIHGRKRKRRYRVDDFGRIAPP